MKLSVEESKLHFIGSLEPVTELKQGLVFKFMGCRSILNNALFSATEKFSSFLTVLRYSLITGHSLSL